MFYILKKSIIGQPTVPEQPDEIPVKAGTYCKLSYHDHAGCEFETWSGTFFRVLRGSIESQALQPITPE